MSRSAPSTVSGSLLVVLLVLMASLAGILSLLVIQYRCLSQVLILNEKAARAKYAALSGLVLVAESPQSLPLLSTTTTYSAEWVAQSIPRMLKLDMPIEGEVWVGNWGQNRVAIAQIDQARVVMVCSSNLNAIYTFQQSKKVL